MLVLYSLLFVVSPNIHQLGFIVDNKSMDGHNKRKLNRNKRCGYLAGTTTCAKYQQYGIDGNVHKYCRVHYNAWKTECNFPEVWRIEVLYARILTIIALGLSVIFITTIAIGNPMWISNQAPIDTVHRISNYINSPIDLNQLWPSM
ncbi:MAG: hypothetical protein ACKN9Z_00485 [Actinomycetota bacterium]